jgi:hypothetical protein
MPPKLTTTIAKISSSIPNKTNAEVIKAYLEYMRHNGSSSTSERHHNNQLKAVIAFGAFLGPDKTFLEIRRKEEISAFLDTKIKPEDVDPERRWITTWNDYLHRLKRFFRWLHCHYLPKMRKMQKEEEGRGLEGEDEGKKEGAESRDDVIIDDDNDDESNWKTPAFAAIKQKKTKRLSPYSENDIWDRDELLTVVKYAANIRDKAILTLFWDLDARNHEITLLKIKDIRLREGYGEGEIPDTAKTGSGPILLTISYPYVRDWLRVHPAKNNPQARLICSLHDNSGGPIQPDALWQMMHERLRRRIRHMIDVGEITDSREVERLEYLLKAKKWNPYCLRHSAITYDGDSLPEFALRKKVRWSMNSRQPARYMKRRMGNQLKAQILAREGIAVDDVLKDRPGVAVCPKCRHVNALEEKVCAKCGWPLSSQVCKQIKAEHHQELEALREELRGAREQQDWKIGQIMNLVRQNPKLANVKPEVLASGQLQIVDKEREGS